MDCYPGFGICSGRNRIAERGALATYETAKGGDVQKTI
jgi:hypothetical protein